MMLSIAIVAILIMFGIHVTMNNNKITIPKIGVHHNVLTNFALLLNVLYGAFLCS